MTSPYSLRLRPQIRGRRTSGRIWPAVPRPSAVVPRLQWHNGTRGGLLRHGFLLRCPVLIPSLISHLPFRRCCLIHRLSCGRHQRAWLNDDKRGCLRVGNEEEWVARCLTEHSGVIGDFGNPKGDFPLRGAQDFLDLPRNVYMTKWETKWLFTWTWKSNQFSW